MEFDEIKFDSDRIVKKPIYDINYHFAGCIHAICSYRGKIKESIQKYKNLFTKDAKRSLKIEEIEEMGKIIFSINTMWNSFGSLILPIKGLYPSIYRSELVELYKKLITIFDNKPELLERVVDKYLIIGKKTMGDDMSEFMISSSSLFNSIQTLMCIKDKSSAKLDDIWYFYKEFCFQTIKNLIDGEKELENAQDSNGLSQIHYTPPIFEVGEKYFDILASLSIMDNDESLNDFHVICYIIGFINAYLYTVYDELKRETVELYKLYENWTTKEKTRYIE